MKLSRTVSHSPGLFSVIPLVNVVFLLLIFFALSSTFVLQPGIAVTLPYSSYKFAPQRNPQIVSITNTPSTAIWFLGQKVTPEELGKSLSDYRIKNKTLIIKADKGTSWDLVMRISDEALQQGYFVDLVTNERPK